MEPQWERAESPLAPPDAWITQNSRGPYKLGEEIKSVASRASCNSQEEIQNVNQERLTCYKLGEVVKKGKKTSYKLQKKIQRVASQTPYKLGGKNIKSALQLTRRRPKRLARYSARESW